MRKTEAESMRVGRRTRGLRAGLLLAVVAGPLAACFSERSATTAPSGSCAASLDPSQYGSTIIAIGGFAFAPVDVHVAVGGKVTWLNCETAGTPAHTSTADGGEWGSTPLDPAATYTFQFEAAGTFGYHCEPHPFMTGRVIVQ